MDRKNILEDSFIENKKNLLKDSCKHRFLKATKYENVCRYCGETEYIYESFGIKIVLGVFGFEPTVFKDEVDLINELHNNIIFDFAKWWSFMEKESDNFEFLSDSEKLDIFKSQSNILKRRKL
jgi:hypothetical protein